MDNQNKYSILDLPQRLKVSRNLAVLGNYIDSLKQYKVSLTLIQNRMSEISDQFLKEKWKTVEAEVKSEISQVSSLYDLCNEFRKVPFDNSKKQDELPTMNSDLIISKTNSINDKKPVISDRFGGKAPFEALEFKNIQQQSKQQIVKSNVDNNVNNIKVVTDWNDNKIDHKIERGNNNKNNYVINNKVKNNIQPMKHVDEPSDLTMLINDHLKKDDKKPIENHDFSMLINSFSKKDNNKEIFNDDNYVIQKPIKKESVERKDPMVWEKPIQIKKEVKKPVSNIKKPVSNKVNIANLYKEAEKHIENKVIAKQIQSDGKKSYLLHVYPDGNGPDSHLIQQLEDEVVDQNPCVSFEDIADLTNAKNILKEAVLLPLLMPNYFTGIRRPWKGVLLYGPPGTGKTMLAKALATQGKTTFFNVHSSSFGSKWRGESEKLVRILFDMAKFYAPTTIFIDEVDAIGSRRTSGDDEASRRVKTEFLVNMDGCNSTSNTNDQVNVNSKEPQQSKLITILGATNRPWDLDEALIRRFEKRVYIALPTEQGREELFKINLKSLKLEDSIDLKVLTTLTTNYSGADIANVCREAAFMGMRRRMLNNEEDIFKIVKETGFRRDIDSPITQEDLVSAINNISKSVSNIDLKNYEDWTKEYKSV